MILVDFAKPASAHSINNHKEIMINNLFELTAKLIHDYIASIHGSSIKDDVKKSNNLVQYYIYADSSKTHLLLIANVTQVLELQFLITFIDQANGGVDSLILNWQEIDFNVDFPLDEINLPNDLITLFNKKIANDKRDKSLENIFKQPIKSIQAPSLGTAQVNTKFQVVDPADSSHKKIPDKPDFDDEYEIRGKLSTSNEFPRGGVSIGDDDLYPGGIKDPRINGHLDPLREAGNNGMSPSFDHPLFGGRFQDGRPIGSRYDEPFGDDDNMDLIGQGLPGFRRSGSNSQPFGLPFGKGGSFGGV